MISFVQYGDFSKFTKYLEKLKSISHNSILDRYGKAGVEALSASTPLDSGETANSWYYTIEYKDSGYTISFSNSHINKGVSIAIILQYGHGTRNGGWVEGRDYINPAIQPIFDKIANDAWKEITSL